MLLYMGWPRIFPLNEQCEKMNEMRPSLDNVGAGMIIKGVMGLDVRGYTICWLSLCLTTRIKSILVSNLCFHKDCLNSLLSSSLI